MDDGRRRVDPILSRSLMLAGFGLALIALGRALAGNRQPGATRVVANQRRCGQSRIYSWSSWRVLATN